MNLRIHTVLLALSVTAGTAVAAPRIVTLEVQSMTCPVCPLTVKKALERVSGVQHVTVDYVNKTATVQFDDATATVDTLTEATKAAGYPSNVTTLGK